MDKERILKEKELIAKVREVYEPEQEYVFSFFKFEQWIQEQGDRVSTEKRVGSLLKASIYDGEPVLTYMEEIPEELSNIPVCLLGICNDWLVTPKWCMLKDEYEKQISEAGEEENR